LSSFTSEINIGFDFPPVCNCGHQSHDLRVWLMRRPYGFDWPDISQKPTNNAVLVARSLSLHCGIPIEISGIRTIFSRPAMQQMAQKRKRLLKKDTILTVYPYRVWPNAGPDLRLPHRRASI
jgi:hypothetical protein